MMVRPGFIASSPPGRFPTGAGGRMRVDPVRRENFLAKIGDGPLVKALIAAFDVATGTIRGTVGDTCTGVR